MVRKNIFVCLLLTASLLGACSKKDDATSDASGNEYDEYFTATLPSYSEPGSSSKVYINNGGLNSYSCWANGDMVNINGTTRSISVSGGVGSYTASIGADGIADIGGGFLAAYPASAASVSGSLATFTIGATTEYNTVASGAGAGQQVVAAPMVAYTTTHDLSFENPMLLSRFAVAASGATVKLKSITISSDRPLSGTYKVQRDGDSWTLNTSGMTGYSRSLTSAEGVTLSSTPAPFYLFLPPVDGASTFTVRFTLLINDVERNFEKTKSGSISMLASKAYDFGTITYSNSTQKLTDQNSVEYTEVEPAGTEGDPYKISNASELYYWTGKYGGTAGKHFKILADFGISSDIGTFAGVLTGDGHTITLSDCALAGTLSGGTISNLITAGSNSVYNYTIGSAKGYGSFAAMAESSATLDHCTNRTTINITDVSATSVMIGGIVGKAAGGVTMNSCSNEGSISVTVSNSSSWLYIGGICGATSASNNHMINCANKGNITTANNTNGYLGGLLGQGAGPNLVVENSYSYANINGPSGNKIGTLTGNFGKKTLQNCYGYRVTSTANDYICGRNESTSTIQYCYGSGDGMTFVGEQNSGTLSNLHQLSSPTTISGGTTDGLATQLNANISTLGITGARSWTTSGGITIFSAE